MKLTYDLRHSIGWIRPREKTAEVETIRLSDEPKFDIGPAGWPNSLAR